MSRAEARDITGEIGPAFTDKLTTVPMFSFPRAAYLFWQGAFDALIAAGLTEQKAFEWLQSKNPRWMLDNDDDMLQKLGRKVTAAYLKRNGTKI